jgi:hypothetical protein
VSSLHILAVPCPHPLQVYFSAFCGAPYLCNMQSSKTMANPLRGGDAKPRASS